jgi:hypothetical protein
MKESRASNFELLRIILILFVLALHYNSPYRHGAFSYIESAPLFNKFFLYSIEALALGAVNTFLCISGYFLSERKSVNVRKVVYLFTVLIAYKALSYLALSIGSGNFTLKNFFLSASPVNYYAWLYGATYLLAPFLNLVFRHTSNKGLNTFISIAVILFSIVPTLSDFCLPSLFNTKASFSAVSLYGNGNGYTLVNFVLLYYIGGYIAHQKACLKPIPAALCYILCTAVICAMMFIDHSRAISYCNIFAIMQAISLFLLFKNIHFNSRIVNNIARSVWGIFIIHTFFVTLFVHAYPFTPAVSGSIPQLLTHFTVCIASTFLCALLWDKVCSLLLRPVNALFDRVKILNREISVSAL